MEDMSRTLPLQSVRRFLRRWAGVPLFVAGLSMNMFIGIVDDSAGPLGSWPVEAALSVAAVLCIVGGIRLVWVNRSAEQTQMPTPSNEECPCRAPRRCRRVSHARRLRTEDYRTTGGGIDPHGTGGDPDGQGFDFTPDFGRGD